MDHPESILIQFYLRQRPNSAGHMIDEILAWNDELLEDIHDYIQWLFPLQETSAFNPNAPLLDERQIRVFKSRNDLQSALRRSFYRLLAFYGFVEKQNGATLTILRSEIFPKRSQDWLTPYNHNFLRITRILKSLMLLGLTNEAKTFERALEELYCEHENIIGKKTLQYWREAIAQARSAD